MTDHLHRDFSLLFSIGELRSFTCIGCDSVLHGSTDIAISSERLGIQDESALPKGANAVAGFELMRNIQYGKFGVHTLAIRSLGHD